MMNRPNSLISDIRLSSKSTLRLAKKLLFFVVPIVYLLSGFYSIGAAQRGVLTRFGQIIDDNVQPGMHYRLPWPIDSIAKVQSSELRSMVIDYSRAVQRRVMQPEMIAQGNDLIDIAFEIQYNIQHPGLFYSTSSNTQQIVEDIAVSEAIYYVSNQEFEDILTSGRSQFQMHLRDQLQQNVNALDLGVNITAVLVRRLEPPRNIKRAFDDLQVASAQQRKVLQDAQARRMTRVAEARTIANHLDNQALTFADEQTQSALGDTQRYLSRLQAFKQSSDIIYHKEYLESVEKLLSQIDLDLLNKD